MKDFKVIEGDMLKILPTLRENSFDACITDPPYELNFMNKGWDRSGIAFQKETWEQVYRVLKPGAYLLAFGGSRTFHRIACAIEDAGFEIRDTIMWLYGSGFPKSLNLGKSIESKLVNGSANTQDWKRLNGTKIESGNLGYSKMQYEQGARPNDYTEDKYLRLDKVDYQTEKGKQWDGWGTCLKPAYEPIIVARKPCEGSITDNVLKYGVGGINIDECRVGNDLIKGGTMPDLDDIGKQQKELGNGHVQSFGQIRNAKRIECDDHYGRFPSNVILTYNEEDYEEVCGGMPYTKSNGSDSDLEKGNQDNPSHLYTNIKSGVHFEDEGSACRYFYCAKASKKDRDEGLDSFEKKEISDGCKRSNPETSNKFGSGERYGKNIHPTVKPVELMQYLIRLIVPRGGVLLDCFAGSGSTGKACAFENRERNANYKCTLVEMTHEYIPIIEARIDYAINKYEYDEIIEREKTGQLSLFDFIGNDNETND